MTGIALVVALRAAWRSVARRPAITIASVVVLGFGVGANLGLYTAVRAYYLRPPAAVGNPDQLRVPELWDAQRGRGSGFSRQEFRDLRSACTSCSFVEAHASSPAVAVLPDGRERVFVQYVTDGYFDALRVQPALGNMPHRRDSLAGDAGVWAVISHGWWVSRFAADSQIVGRAVRIGSDAANIVAVAPPGFAGLVTGPVVHAWLASREPQSAIEERDRSLRIIARGASATASPQLMTALGRLAEERRLGGDALRSELRPRVRGASPGIAELRAHGILTVTLLGFAFALAIVVLTCINLAQMAFAKALARRHQTAIQLSLGARRRHVLLPIVCEQAMVPLVATSGGLAGAWWVLRQILARAGMSEVQVTPDLPVVGAALAIATLVMIAVSVVPVIFVARTDASAMLRTTASVGGVWGMIPRRALIGAQVLVASVLLSCAVAFVRSAQLVAARPTGVVASNTTVVASLDFGDESGTHFPNVDTWARVATRVGAQHGIDAIGLAERLPLDRGVLIPFAIRGQSGAGEDRRLAVRTAIAGDFFEALGMPLLAGSSFPDGLRGDAERVAVVSAAFAATLGGPRAALDVFIQEGDAGGPWTRVIGVVRDVDRASGSSTTPVAVYVPAVQTSAIVPTPRVVVVPRAGVTSVQAIGALRRGVEEATGAGAVYDERTLTAYVDGALAARRLGGGLLTALGLLALAIAATGCYGSAAFTAAQRTREAGVRAALGANRLTLLRQFSADGLYPAAVGALCGMVAGIVSVRALSAYFEGLGEVEWLLFPIVACASLALAAVSAIRPTWAVASVDPATALRAE